MSRVRAFVCDHGSHIVIAEEAVGIIPTEDLFNKMDSYPTEMNPDKCLVHYCVGCYTDNVMREAAKQVNRKKGEELYKRKLYELAYMFREETVRRWRDKNRFVEGHGNPAKKTKGKK